MRAIRVDSYQGTILEPGEVPDQRESDITNEDTSSTEGQLELSSDIEMASNSTLQP
jgi:hypothetical protein